MSPCNALAAACLALVETADFSDEYRSPTLLDWTPGASIQGRWSGKDDYDIIAISGLEGGQTLLFSFRPLTDEIGYSYSAGGTLLYQNTPFLHSNWEGRAFGNPSLDYHDHARQTYSLTLGDDFNATGRDRAYVGLYGTHGSLGYTISVIGP